MDGYQPENPEGPSAVNARAEARLSLALFRGLLLDLVGTEDRAGVDRAFEVYRRLEAIARTSGSAGALGANPPTVDLTRRALHPAARRCGHPSPPRRTLPPE